MRWALACALVAAPVWSGEIAPEGLADLPKADVVVLGEVHDNPGHHALQAEAVRAIAPKAVVWEMIPAGMAVTGDLSDAAALAAALDWQARGWPDFAMYHPIFLSAGGARHYGADVPRGLVRRAVSEGAAAVSGDGARFGLDRRLPDAEQAAREAEQMAAHCDALPENLLPGMVEAQRLRDAALARAVVQALDEVGPPVAVITGWGHARKDWGLPAVLAWAAPEVSVLSIGLLESDPGADAPFDLWLVTAPVDRPDPCAQFR